MEYLIPSFGFRISSLGFGEAVFLPNSRFTYTGRTEGEIQYLKRTIPYLDLFVFIFVSPKKQIRNQFCRVKPTLQQNMTSCSIATVQYSGTAAEIIGCFWLYLRLVTLGNSK